MKLDLEQRPSLVHARYGNHRSGHEHHRVPNCWFVHFYRYHAKLTVDGEVFQIEPGSVSILAPGVSMDYHFPHDRNEHIYIRLAGSRSEGPHELPTMLPAGAIIGRLHHQAEATVAAARWSTSRAEIKIWDILWRLYELSAMQGHRSTVVDRALSWIELNLSEPSVVPAICASLSISYSRLNALFKERLGSTFGAYVRQCRMEKAEHLLKETTLTVKEIAGQCGYVDLQQFNKLVRKNTGRSPRAHRG